MADPINGERVKPRAQRVPAVVQVQYRFDTIQEIIAEYSVDISMSGIFIRTDRPLEVGSRIHLQIMLQDGSTLIEGRGRVARIGLSLRGQMGMGVEFVDFDKESMALIEKLVATRLGQGDGV